MEHLAPSEKEMWNAPLKAAVPKLSDEDINAKYGKRELRIVFLARRFPYRNPRNPSPTRMIRGETIPPIVTALRVNIRGRW